MVMNMERMLERDFTNVLIDWKENNIKTPLMIIGARQTGKSCTVQEFCNKNFENFVEINLELEEEIKEFFETTLKPEEIIRYIKLIKRIDIDIENTVIFFDEIQTSERAITSLKYFAESKENYKIITAGSLLRCKAK